MSASLSKEFFEFVKAIGESKSKQEEDRAIATEIVALKHFMTEKPGSGANWNRKQKEFLIRLLYVEMLGHDASWGYVSAVQQTASTDLAQKRAAYLTCGQFLSPDHEFRFMLVNQMQRDLASANVLEVSAALVAVCKLVTTDMIPAVLPKVGELVNHQQTLVRKKALMAIHRFHQLQPSSVGPLVGQVKGALRDRDPAVMGAALCVLHDMVGLRRSIVVVCVLYAALRRSSSADEKAPRADQGQRLGTRGAVRPTGLHPEADHRAPSPAGLRLPPHARTVAPDQAPADPRAPRQQRQARLGVHVRGGGRVGCC